MRPIPDFLLPFLSSLKSYSPEQLITLIALVSLGVAAFAIYAVLMVIKELKRR